MHQQSLTRLSEIAPGVSVSGIIISKFFLENSICLFIKKILKNQSEELV